MKDQVNLRNMAVTCLTILALSVPGISNATTDIKQVFIFGDSLADPGNIYALTGETFKAPYEPVPEFPYAVGGHPSAVVHNALGDVATALIKGE